MYLYRQTAVDVIALPQSVPVRIIFVKESLNLHRLENIDLKMPSQQFIQLM